MHASRSTRCPTVAIRVAVAGAPCSASVFVGAGSDLGGGCSTMGTLSGGNKALIAVGRECLIGANAGTGISLGDRCTIEAGLYVTAGSRVTVIDEAGAVVKVVAARDLSGGSDMLFRRNYQTTSSGIRFLANSSGTLRARSS